MQETGLPMDRREFIHLAAGGAMASALSSSIAVPAAMQPPIRAIVFDAFPIFDPRPAAALAETLFPGKGTDLSNAWRTRQFEYQWLRALSGRYADFLQTTEDALVFSAKLLHLDLTAEKRAQLMQSYHALKVWPDVPDVLGALRKGGFRLAFLSNMTARMLEDGIRNAGLEGTFEQVLSTDRIRSFKPDPRAYRMTMDALKLKREEILFVAFAGWDAAGAKWFGYPTFWVNRLNLPAEELGVDADATGRDLSALANYLNARG